MVTTDQEKRIENIPLELKELSQWVNWKTEIRYGKATKVPLNPRTLGNAQSNNQITWGAFEESTKNINEGIGIGIVLTEDDPYTGIDLDKCRNPQTGTVEQWATDIINEIQSYCEVSPSNTGIRIICKAKLPKGGRKKGRIETYDSGRFFTITGNVINGFNEIKILDGNKLHSFLMDTAKDVEIIDKIFKSNNGEKFSELWEGNWSAYPSQSEADMALCSTLYFYTKDRIWTDKLFRSSKLFREKWDEKHFSDGSTYGGKILDTVCKNNDRNSEEKQEKLSREIRVVSISEFLKLELQPRENMLNPWLPTQGLAMVCGPRGIGKTYFSMGVAVAVASGGQFLKWTCETPYGVLYIDGEMPAVVDQERLSSIILSSDKEPLALLNIITPDLQEYGMPDLSTDHGQKLLETHLEGISLVIVDNISTLCRQGRENESESWLPVQEWGLRLRSKHISVLFIHHTGKGGLQRGTSRREDVLDTIIALKRPSDYQTDEGARFEVHFDKARNIYGEDVKPFEAKLITIDGIQQWTIKDLEESLTERVANLLNEGIPQSEIYELLGVSKGTVSKHKKKAQAQGLLKVQNE